MVTDSSVAAKRTQSSMNVDISLTFISEVFFGYSLVSSFTETTITGAKRALR